MTTDILSSIEDLKNAGFTQNQAKAIVDTFCTIPKDKDYIINNLVESGLKETQAKAIPNLIFREYKNKK
jgi:hypothetical protein